MKISLRLWQGARPRRAGVQCEKTEAAIQEPIAAPAWPRYGTRLPLRHLCVLLAVRAAGVGFRRRRGALCGQLHLGSGFLADRRSATTHLAIYHRPSYERQGSRHKFLAVQPHMPHVNHFGPVHLVEF